MNELKLALRNDDSFDMFSDWLVSFTKYNFKGKPSENEVIFIKIFIKKQ